MSGNTIELLHLSDLHFGPHSRFAGGDPAALGRSFASALTQERKRLGLTPRLDLVTVTGDLAEAGKPKEFASAAAFLGALAEDLKLSRREFVFVPGNHDVSWFRCMNIENELKEDDAFTEAEFQKRIAEAKLDRYTEFLQNFYGAKPEDIVSPVPRGACLYNYPSLRLTVAALNSCEAESHRKADHRGLVTEEQAKAVMDAWRSPDLAGWIKIVAVHHNPVVTVPANIANWRKWLKEAGSLDDELLARYESDVVGFEGRERLEAIVKDTSVQLVLHGHHHAKDEHSWHWKGKGRAHILSAGSLILEPGHLPKDEPASFRLISLDLKKKEIRARSLVFYVRARAEGEVKKGFFVPDPAEPDGYTQTLDFPPGFSASKEKEKATRKAGGKGKLGPSPEFLQTYRQRLGSLFSRWDLAFAGVTQAGGAGRPIEATLDHMYLPLRLAQGFDLENTNQGERISPDTLVTRRTPLVVRGSAGAGKTTWLRWTFRRLLEQEDAFPLIIVLRDLARRWQDPECKDADRSLDAFLSGWLAQQLGIEIAECREEMRRALTAKTGSRPVLLVDGWDEVGPLGEELRSKLLGLMTEHPRLLVVVTSRPYGEGRPSNSEGFEILDIQPLSDEEIADLASRFFPRCYGEELLTAEEEAKHLVGSLNQAPDAKALARTALLLTMMLLISRSRPLPDKRHLLYEACIENLLTAIPKRRAEQGALSLPDQWRPEDSEERMRVVATLAYNLQEKGYGQLNRFAIVQTWEEMIKFLPNWGRPKCVGFLAWLAGPAGLLTDRADGSLVFTHLSFQEYLVAWHLDALIEGKEDRVKAFRKYLSNSAWWETLRLWAALIERQSPERIEPVLESLTNFNDEGLSLSGMMLADGLGEESFFLSWADIMLQRLSTGTGERSLELCSRIWAGSRQEERKRYLSRELSARAMDQTWIGWLRYDGFCAALHQDIPFPREGSLGRTILLQLYGPTVDSRSVAAGRVLCERNPIWPPEPMLLGLLQVWPSRRRLAGLKIQAALSIGASRGEITLLSAELLKQSAFVSEARILASKLARKICIMLMSEMGIEFIHDLACDWARDLVCGLPNASLELLSSWSYSIGLEFFQKPGRPWCELFFGESARRIARHSDRGLNRDQFLYFKLEMGAVEYLSSYFACRLQLKGRAAWLEGFVRLLLSVWLSGARAVLANVGNTGCSEGNMLALACRHSVGRENRTKDLSADSSSMHPLWPALARHIARLSTPDDRALLIDLAQNPEQCEPPLSWGLQYIVRGDLLLEDGSVLTLDELADEVGLPHLPYLEEMPDELEVDWEAAED